MDMQKIRGAIRSCSYQDMERALMAVAELGESLQAMYDKEGNLHEQFDSAGRQIHQAIARELGVGDG